MCKLINKMNGNSRNKHIITYNTSRTYTYICMLLIVYLTYYNIFLYYIVSYSLYYKIHIFNNKRMDYSVSGSNTTR